MDNITVCYQGIQRVYRNAVVNFLRERLTQKFAHEAVEKLMGVFGNKTPTGQTQWEAMIASANERRASGTGEVSSNVRDQFDILGVNHFFNVFEKFFAELCPAHASKPKDELAKARSALTGWAKTIKNLRDPLSHPSEEDFSDDDAALMLITARKILDFLQLPVAAAELADLRKRFGQPTGVTAPSMMLSLPPEEEVVFEFVGRGTELETLNEWILNPRRKRWVLSGAGGKGKSAIAYQFACLTAARTDTNLDAIIWISAKRRRFIEGATLEVDRPDFCDLETALDRIIIAYGFNPEEQTTVEAKIELARDLLCEFPALIIVDDIDTLDESQSDAVEFLQMDLPNCGHCRVLLTSRRALRGLEKCTTQVTGFTAADGARFIETRFDMAKLGADLVMERVEEILAVTDSSPLFIEDLLRLLFTGISISEAIGLWRERKGDAAREYAIRREYDLLQDDAKYVLLALSVIPGSCSTNELTNALGWNSERVVDALVDLKKMFLMPSASTESESSKLMLNMNTKTLVVRSFHGTDAFQRTKRLMGAAKGTLKTTIHDERRMAEALNRAHFCMIRSQYDDAQRLLEALGQDFPGDARVFAKMGELFKRWGRPTDSRAMFQRAAQLNCKILNMYREWARLECEEDEWTAAADAADKGLRVLSTDSDLNYLKGYAFHRAGKEYCKNGFRPQGFDLCERAVPLLHVALDASRSHQSTRHRGQIHRALVLNAEALEDEVKISKYLEEWRRDHPTDPMRVSEYKRLRGKYPRYLPAI